MSKELAGKKVAFIATDGFEPSELLDPLSALRESGATCTLIAPEKKKIRGWKKDWTEEIEVDATFDEVSATDFNALIIAGGTLNCDTLRTSKKAVKFVKDVFDAKKPVSAICHGPQMLIEADVVKEKKLTSFSAIKTDLINAGAHWVDQEVVVDKGLTTSRTPDDLPAFISKSIEEIAEGKHADRSA